MKIGEIIERIQALHPDLKKGTINSMGVHVPTVDGLICGDPEQECTGIITTVYASIEVIKKACELGANLILTHEGTFYSNTDETEWLKGNRVYEEKRKLLEEHNIVIFRDHDGMHHPEGDKDYIFAYIAKALGWEDYAVDNKLRPRMFVIPETTAGELADRLLQKFNLNGMRMIGDPDRKVSKIYFFVHFYGTLYNGDPDKNGIRMIEKEKPDVVIPGEIVDYTFSEYARDAAQLGLGPVVMELGHFNAEEPAMLIAENWLRPLVGTDIPIYPVQSGDSFQYRCR